MVKQLSIVIFGFLLLFQSIAFSEELPSLILLPVQGNNLSESDKINYRTALQKSLSTKYYVFSGTEVEKRLKKYSERTCDATECLQEVAIDFQGELVGRLVVTSKPEGYLLAIEIKNIFTDGIIETENILCEKCNTFSVVRKLQKLGNPVNTLPEFDAVKSTPENTPSDLNAEKTALENILPEATNSLFSTDKNADIILEDTEDTFNSKPNESNKPAIPIFSDVSFDIRFIKSNLNSSDDVAIGSAQGYMDYSIDAGLLFNAGNARNKNLFRLNARIGKLDIDTCHPLCGLFGESTVELSTNVYGLGIEKVIDAKGFLPRYTFGGSYLLVEDKAISVDFFVLNVGVTTNRAKKIYYYADINRLSTLTSNHTLGHYSPSVDVSFGVGLRF